MLRMKLLKPSWVSHEGHPIFSVDIHPDGSRFATGGQGADTGRVVIWNMAPVISETDEKDENVPRMLCHMDNHLACVNCVRWSGSGKYLASGGDDKVIMIWQTGRYASGSTGFGQGGKVVNIEHWRCVCSLRGHSGDVLDLAWSPHDAWLASCSVDNTVVVWNTLKWQEVIAVLRGHTGLVKGVSWDPVGRYLSSQSDDKSLRIWRTHDWQEETVVTEPFEECGGTTHTLRLSWSPDGQYLVSAHAMNNSGPTAQIIERDGWKTNKDFVGHRKAITCVRFNPNILSKANKESGKVQHFCCCAIGSRDRSLSVWLTCLKRPLVVVHDLFSNSVLDISWSSHGYHLLICSWDGTVAYVDFSEEEIGKPISGDERNILHQRLYGKSVMNHSHSLSTIVENPELLYLQEAKLLKEKEKTPLQNGEKHSSSSKPSEKEQPQPKTLIQFKGPIDKQIETRMPDGRRRITPLFIPMQADDGDVPLPFNSRAQPTFSSSSESKSRIIIEKRDEITGTTTQTTFNLKRSIDTADSATAPPVALSRPASPPKEVSKKIEAQSVEKVQTSSQPVVTQPSQPAVESAEMVVESSKPPQLQQSPVKVVSTLDETPVYIPTKKKSDLPVSGPGRPIEKRKPGRPPLSQSASVAAPIAEKEVRTDHQSHSSGHSLHLPIPKIEKIITAQVAGDKPDDAITYEVENNLNLGMGLIAHRLRRTSASESVWEVLLSSRGTAIAASRHLVCVACEDSTMSIFSSRGKRLASSIVLSSPATRLNCNNYFAMVITSRGAVYIWNMQTCKAVVNNESLLPIMQGPNNLRIRSTGMTDAGHAMVSLSTGKSYVFNVDLGSWTLVSSADDVVQQCSNHFRSMPPQECVNGKVLPLASLQGQLHRRATNLFLSNPGIQQAGTLSHLDSQIAASITLHSGKEYRFWLMTMVRYLVQEGLEERLRDICENLFGPLVKSKASNWQPYFLGLHRHDLLKEILPMIGSNLQLQRLFTEFKEQLDAVGS